jgi:phosphoglycerate dehydrogenase-like enzyme
METSRLRVAFVGALASSFADRVRAHLTAPCEFVHTDEQHATDVLPDADVVVTLVFTREMSAVAGRLRLIQVPGAGLDRIDRAAVPPGSSLAAVHGHEAGIAEYVLGAMIALSRDFLRVDAGLRAGRWDSQWAPGVPPPPVWPELAGRTLGILGYGGIGQAVARRARAFDMRIFAIRRDVGRSAEDDLALLADLGKLPEVLQRADYLAITLPLTPETRGLIGDPQLRLMKPTAILVNVARAQILDEDALYSALVEKRIAGAALDVWYRYPVEPGPLLPARRPFHELPNVLMTPHLSGWTDGMMEARATLIAENIRRTACGEPPENMVPAPPIG